MCLREGQTKRKGGRKRSVLEYMSIPSLVSMHYGRVQIDFVQRLSCMGRAQVSGLGGKWMIYLTCSDFGFLQCLGKKRADLFSYSNFCLCIAETTLKPVA